MHGVGAGATDRSATPATPAVPREGTGPAHQSRRRRSGASSRRYGAAILTGSTARVPSTCRPRRRAARRPDRLQATQRLAIEPFLRDFSVKLTLLPLEKLDAEALRPFGYDLFAGVPSTFAPVTDVPVPSEYVVGPGDRLEVQLIGNTKGRHSLVVNRDGRVKFPELGPSR